MFVWRLARLCLMCFVGCDCRAFAGTYCICCLLFVCLFDVVCLLVRMRCCLCLLGLFSYCVCCCCCLLFAVFIVCFGICVCWCCSCLLSLVCYVRRLVFVVCLLCSCSLCVHIVFDEFVCFLAFVVIGVCCCLFLSGWCCLPYLLC